VPTLIFVHGACVRDAPWWWSRMTEPLAGHGIANVAVPLPSCGETGDGLGDLYADVDAAVRAIAEADAPVVLCGHSYGGMVITTGARLIDFPSGHHPFLSQPEAFAHSIAAEIESVG
jgi:pimeloyl-ACP methyl ester carboxylesterase